MDARLTPKELPGLVKAIRERRKNLEPMEKIQFMREQRHWIRRDGSTVAFEKMTDQHVENAFNYFCRAMATISEQPPGVRSEIIYRMSVMGYEKVKRRIEYLQDEDLALALEGLEAREQAESEKEP